MYGLDRLTEDKVRKEKVWMRVISFISKAGCDSV